jgi:hypothetical protein
MTDIIEAEATVTGMDLSVTFTPAEIEANLDAVEAFVREQVAPYATDGAIAVTDRQGAKWAKGVRAALNAMSKEFNSRRIAMKKAYLAPYEAFEARLKEIDGLMTGEAAKLGDALKAFDALALESRYDGLREHYEAYAGALADMLPWDGFRAIADDGWHRQPHSELEDARIKREIEDRVKKSHDDWQTLKGLGLSRPDEAERAFFRTLSLSAAIDAASQADDEQARLEQLREASAAAQASLDNAAVGPIAGQVAAVPQAGPENALESTVAPQNGIHVLELDCTDDELAAVVAFCKASGIHGRVVS